MGQYEDETLGIALAGELTVFALIGRLKAKGFLTKAETVAIYEQTLTALEAYPHFERGVEAARKVLDQMAMIASKSPPDAPIR